MKIICAWCGREMGEREGIHPISHGICEKCRKKVLREANIQEVLKDEEEEG